MEGGGMDQKEVIVMCELPGCMGLIPGAGGASKAVVPERAAEVVKGPGRLGGTRGGRPGGEDSGVEGDVRVSRGGHGGGGGSMGGGGAHAQGGVLIRGEGQAIAVTFGIVSAEQGVGRAGGSEQAREGRGEGL